MNFSLRGALAVLGLLAGLALLIAGIVAVSRANEQQTVAYARQFGLSPAGTPENALFHWGPFNYCNKGDQIWSLAVLHNDRPATLWVRFGLFDSVYLVDAGGAETELK